MNKKNFMITGILAAVSVAFTLLTRVVDVQAIGPEGSSVGFASINEWVHNLFGVNMIWYNITDWLGLVPIFTALIFAFAGLVQLIKRKSLFKVDLSIIALGVFYILVAGIYIFFEKIIVNYRPILMDGYLEASYPSSHTMIVCCFMSVCILECRELIKNEVANRIIGFASIVIIVVTVVGRLISGVHWFTDIVGGLLISATVVMLFYSFICKNNVRQCVSHSHK